MHLAAWAALAAVAAPVPPTPDGQFDYQLAGDYEPPAGVTVLTRDWFSGQPMLDICADKGFDAVEYDNLDSWTRFGVIGFDFGVAEECGFYEECEAYTDVFGDNLIVIEYTEAGFAAACDAVGERVAVVLRDIDLTVAGSDAYVYEHC